MDASKIPKLVFVVIPEIGFPQPTLQLLVLMNIQRKSKPEFFSRSLAPVSVLSNSCKYL